MAMVTTAVTVHALRRACLGDRAGLEWGASSHAVDVPRSTVVLSVTMLKGSNVGGAEIQIRVQVRGSYDGRVWHTDELPLVTFGLGARESAAGPETACSERVGVDFALLRVTVSVVPSDASGAALLDATLSFLDP